MNLPTPTPTPRSSDDAAALDLLASRLDAIFGDLISYVEFAELIEMYAGGTR